MDEILPHEKKERKKLCDEIGCFIFKTTADRTKTVVPCTRQSGWGGKGRNYHEDIQNKFCGLQAYYF